MQTDHFRSLFVISDFLSRTVHPRFIVWNTTKQFIFFSPPTIPFLARIFRGFRVQVIGFLWSDSDSCDCEHLLWVKIDRGSFRRFWNCTFEQVYFLSLILRHGRWLCSDVAEKKWDSRRTTLSGFVASAPWTHAHKHDLRRLHWYGWFVLCPQYEQAHTTYMWLLMRRSMPIAFFVCTSVLATSEKASGYSYIKLSED